MNTHVIKVGGENASDQRTARWLADFSRQDNQVAVAISALRTKPLNTTSELIDAKNVFVSQKQISPSLPILERLYSVHMDTVKAAGMYDPQLGDTIQALFTESFPQDLTTADCPVDQDFDVWCEQKFLGYREIMSATVLSHLLNTRHRVEAILISRVDDMTPMTLSDTLKNHLAQKVSSVIRSGAIAIVPGYVAVPGQLYLPSYGRGYTDKMAERLAVGLSNHGHHSTLHIQKQVPLFSSHPGNIPNAKPLERLSYQSAGEITGARGANAQVLNEHVITRDLTKRDIPIWVYNPFEAGVRTVISGQKSTQAGIQFVDGRSGVNSLTVSGFGLSGPGLLARLTEVLSLYGVSIDSISSSETEVTCTMYQKLSPTDQLQIQSDIQHTFGDEYDISFQGNLGMIYCIGDNLSDHPGILGQISHLLARESIDIKYVSQSLGQRAVTIGVDDARLSEAIAVLHRGLIEESN